jgi:uncharacterized protein YsxB (DUF464 family)
MKHRWPASIHCQIEAVFQGIRAFRQCKEENPEGIRSSGTWNVYRRGFHLFANFLTAKGVSNILESVPVAEAMAFYLREKLNDYVSKKRSRQTFETILSALGKLSYAINNYIQLHDLNNYYPTPLDVEDLRHHYYLLSRKLLPMSSRAYDSRAFPDPIRLIENIDDQVHQLQALIQFEGGFRCEGVGAPRGRFKNPLTADSLLGIAPDPLTGLPVGHVAAKEKGGKVTCHYISVVTYRRLESYIRTHGKLESDYAGYVAAINDSAKKTGQYVSGRGSHALKTNFAEERYHECVRYGLTHEQAAQRTSRELAHFRLGETLTYTRGRK